MRVPILMLMAAQLLKHTFKSSAIYFLVVVITLMMSYAAYSGWNTYKVQNSIREHYQREARESWESNPDKHPHRMAHYGSFAFRLKHPLSMFDFGMESFTGNAVYLEAHKQNTVNFSEASFSTGLLRFGEISMAMILQVIIPLAIFFLGFSCISAERESGTLKVMLTQGATWKEILVGKALGLTALTMLFFVPAALLAAILLFNNGKADSDVMTRFATILLAYIIYYFILCVITICISAVSKVSRDALIRLLGIWLCFVILLPKTTQAIGSYLYPAPSKIEFEAAIEHDIIRQGDSHNPDDPHYKAMKDSLLSAYQVDSVHKLPFNYSGFVMREGERLSAVTYQRHLKDLFSIYEDQNRLNRFTAFINPYTAIRNISMALSGTDFSSYIHFQHEAEAYRYNLAQTMNELQIKYISNQVKSSADKSAILDREHWLEFPDFKYTFQVVGYAFEQEALSIAALLVWFSIVTWLIIRLSKKLKAI
ncbi:MAG: DUF3526 domain-containing protein [Cytophagia bacterium]|nr:DUF3526 domain-containing protein [Cytophagia bacterium]